MLLLSLQNQQLNNLSTEQNRIEQNRIEQNRTEQNRTEQNRTEQNRTEQNRTEQNRTEQHRTEQNHKKDSNKTSERKEQVNIPSMSLCGSFLIISRSLQVPGSDSSAFTTKNDGLPSDFFGIKDHFNPEGKPAPPLPLNPLFLHS
jgi:sRNA-binding protein